LNRKSVAIVHWFYMSKIAKVRSGHQAAPTVSNLGVSSGSVSAAGNQILRVCFGEFIAGGYC